MNNNIDNNNNIENNNNNGNINNIFCQCCRKVIVPNNKIQKQKKIFKIILAIYIIFTLLKILFVSSSSSFISFLGIFFIFWTNNSLYYVYPAIAIFIFIYSCFLSIEFIGVLVNNFCFKEIPRLNNVTIIKFILYISVFDLVFQIFLIITLFDYYKNLKIRYFEQYGLNWPRNNRNRFNIRNNNANVNQNNQQFNNNNLNNNNLNNNNNNLNNNNNNNDFNINNEENQQINLLDNENLNNNNNN